MNKRLWVGKSQPIDYPHVAPPPPPRVTAQVEVVLERSDVFRTLRDMGDAMMTYDPDDIRVTKPVGDFRASFVGRDATVDRIDLRHDEAPLSRSLYAS